MLYVPHLYINTLSKMPPVPSASVTYLSTQTATADATNRTFSAVSIGTPHPKRVVVCAVFHGVAAACTVTVNGIASYVRSQNTAHEVSIHAIKVPNGTTGDIVVDTGAGTQARCACAVFVIYPENHYPLDSGTATATTTNDAVVSDMKVQAGGSLIYAGCQLSTLGTFTTTWNGSESVTEDVDAQLEATSSYTMGHIDVTTSTDLSDLTMAESTSGTKRLAVITFGPSRR